MVLDCPVVRDASLVLNRQALDEELFPVSSHSSALWWSPSTPGSTLRDEDSWGPPSAGWVRLQLCSPLALPHCGLHSPALLAYPHTTSQTGEHVAPRLHRVLSVNTLSFRSFSFRLSCFQAKTNLLYYYPQLISYFPQNHASLHLSSLSLMYKFTWLICRATFERILTMKMLFQRMLGMRSRFSKFSQQNLSGSQQSQLGFSSV